MAGVKLRDDEWQPLYDARDARDWIFPIEALAYGDAIRRFSGVGRRARKSARR